MSDRFDPQFSLRTCVGCRKTERPDVLLRVALSRPVALPVEAGTVAQAVPDPRRRLKGRGAWIHPDHGCFQAAERRRAFGRALRVPAGIALDTQQVIQYLNTQVRNESAGDPS